MSNDTVHRSDFSPTRPRRPRIVAAAYRVGLKTSPCSRVRSRGPSRVRSVFRFRAGFRFVELARRPGPSPSAGRAAPRPERLLSASGGGSAVPSLRSHITIVNILRPKKPNRCAQSPFLRLVVAMKTCTVLRVTVPPWTHNYVVKRLGARPERGRVRAATARDCEILTRGGGFQYSGSYPMVFQHSDASTCALRLPHTY